MTVVYALKHLSTNKIYVGSTNNPVRRLRDHMNALKAGQHPCKKLQDDFNQYGEKFSFQILGEKKHTRDKTEEFLWMKVLRTYDERFGYNTNDMAMIPSRRAAGLPWMESKRKGRKFPKHLED